VVVVVRMEEDLLEVVLDDEVRLLVLPFCRAQQN
jgi:hypothetical protein